MLDRAISKKRLFRERNRINKVSTLFLDEHRLPNGKQPTPEEKQCLEDLGRSLHLVNTQPAALAKT
jgi:hypothetical protein